MCFSSVIAESIWRNLSLHIEVRGAARGTATLAGDVILHVDRPKRIRTVRSVGEYHVKPLDGSLMALKVQVGDRPGLCVRVGKS